eukprot:gene27083-29852_t
MKNLIPATNINETAQLDEVASFFKERLGESLQYIISQKRQWEADGYGMGIKGDNLSEMLHHSQVAHEMVSSFCGQEDKLSEAIGKISDTPRSDGAPFSAISCCIVGASGTGKSALMAKIADEIFSQREKLNFGMIPVLIRFCGTSA